VNVKQALQTALYSVGTASCANQHRFAQSSMNNTVIVQPQNGDCTPLAFDNGVQQT
jgi:hypothetical protein